MLIPLALIIQYFAEVERRKALAASNVKVKGVDVMASIKIGTCLCLYPIYLFGFSFLFYLYCCRYLNWDHSKCLEATIVFSIVFPINSISKILLF